VTKTSLRRQTIPHSHQARLKASRPPARVVRLEPLTSESPLRDVRRAVVATLQVPSRLDGNADGNPGASRRIGAH
jgi:hypothetical protein